MHSFRVKGVFRSSLRGAIFAVFGALLLAAAPALAVPIYSITDLGTLGGNNSNALDINDAGQVVGFSTLADGTRHAFFYDPVVGIMKDLGTFGFDQSAAFGINNTGRIVGYAYFGTSSRGFVYNPDGTTTILDTLGGDHSIAAGINNAGKVVGSADTSMGPSHAVLYDPTVSTAEDLGLFGGFTSGATAINDSGIILGLAEYSDGRHSIIYDSTLGTWIDLGGGSIARDINNTGQVVGGSIAADGLRHAFLYENGVMKDLGALGGDTGASGINDIGQVVGSGLTAANQVRAFLWDGGVMYDLNDLIDPDNPLAGSVLVNQANDINEHGDIVGRGCYIAGPYLGECHAFLLTALDIEFVRSVPEPGSLALLGSALLGIPLARRLRAVRY